MPGVDSGQSDVFCSGANLSVDNSKSATTAERPYVRVWANSCAVVVDFKLEVVCIRRSVWRQRRPCAHWHGNERRYDNTTGWEPFTLRN